MRTDAKKKGLRLSQSTLPEMRARLALLNTAICALQRYQGYSDEDIHACTGDTAPAPGIRPKPFLVVRRETRAKKAS